MADRKTGSGSPGQDYYHAFRDQVLVWNRSMNLVSRRDPERICDGLVEQCRGAFTLVERWLGERDLIPDDGNLLYVDVGSGGGFPGVIWSRSWLDAGYRPRSFLVEPREKRAWFLGRLQDEIGNGAFRVSRHRWGDPGLSLEEGGLPGLVVISLKALLLNDFTVIDGLRALLNGNPGFAGGLVPLVIVRFQPPDQVLDQKLEESLALTDEAFGWRVRPHFVSRHILGPTTGLLPASLLVTQYTLAFG